MAKSDKKIRVYADTSVFGGVFDDEFQDASRAFFDAVHKKSFSLLTSELVREEIQGVPEKVSHLFEEMLPIAEVLEVIEYED